MQVLVIGGGAAGLMAAGTAAQNGCAVTLLERNAKPAMKVRITGKGRCNVTNHCADTQTLIANIPGNGRFLYSAFSAFTPHDTMDFFENLGVPLKTHCRATMEAISVDCDVYNTRTVEKLEVSDAEWKTMQKAIGKKAIKERKPYPEDHEEIHAVGCEWTRRRGASEHSDIAPSQPFGSKGKWNAQKSSNVKH